MQPWPQLSPSKPFRPLCDLLKRPTHKTALIGIGSRFFRFRPIYDDIWRDAPIHGAGLSSLWPLAYHKIFFL
jgi:hypothetical protein